MKMEQAWNGLYPAAVAAAAADDDDYQEMTLCR
jgi:hypothetical protein